MRRLGELVGRFLKAEEVPRWFGLSLVVIYLVGLGTVARLGIALARRDGMVYYQQSSQFAVGLLAEQLHAIDQQAEDANAALSEGRRALREFAAAIPTRSIRLIEGSRVVASLQPADSGTTVEGTWAADLRPGVTDVSVVPSADSMTQERVLRCLVTARAAADPPGRGSDLAAGPPLDGEPLRAVPIRYLEVTLPREVPGAGDLANQAGMLAVVLIVLGALFLAYRCLREQLRSVWRIADRLETHRSNLAAELSSLRIGDTLDEVTAGWNELVDLTQSLLESVRRAEANEELSRALQKQSGGAVAEALHALPDGLLYIADEVRFEFVNTAALRLFGWSVQDGKRPTLKEAQSAGVGGQVLRLLQDSLKPDGRFDARTEIIESADDQSSYRVFVIPLPRGRHDGQCIVVIRDVSQQIRAERAREEFVAQVTHELRTPLTNIRAYAETLSSGMFEDPKVITECYNVITKETRRLSRLIEDILSVSQLEVGSIELRIDQVDLKTLLGEGLRDVRGLADEKNIDVQLVLPAKLESVRGDRDKLAVVVNNLLGNAIKYTPANGNVIVGCQVAAESVILTFKDNGIGIDPKDHARVFEKFQRGSNPEVQQETGTGIGLYTAREIVRRHGGDIEVISERGKGSTFMVRLPKAESRAGALSTAAEGGHRG